MEIFNYVKESLLNSGANNPSDIVNYFVISGLLTYENALRFYIKEEHINLTRKGMKTYDIITDLSIKLNLNEDKIRNIIYNKLK